MARPILLSAWFISQVVAQFPNLPQITPAPVLNHAVLAFNAAVTDSGYSACQSAADAVDYCSSALGDLSGTSNSRIAQCLCCSGSVWTPDDFDDSAETCASYLQTELPGSTAEYSAYSILGGFCTLEGNVCGPRTGTATASATRTASATAAAVSPGCYSLLDIISECEESHAGITTQPLESQAGCYCYTTSARSTAWAPDVFDDYGSECARWASTADPSNYSSWKVLATFCSGVGDVLTSSTSVSTRTRTTTSGRDTLATATSTTPAAFETATTNTETGTGTTTTPTSAAGASPTRTNAAAGVARGQRSTAVAMAAGVMAVFSYLL